MARFPWRTPGRFVGSGLLVLSVAVLGCGGGTGTVTGTVSYKGTPLKGGNVTFVAADKQTHLSAIGEDGRYTIEKLALGTAQISVETDSLAQMARRPRYGPPAGAEAPGGYKPPDPAEAAKRYVQIPKPYGDPATSGLTYDVKRGSQQYPIDLK